MLKQLKNFFKEEVWTHDLTSKSRRRIFLIRQMRIYIMAFKGFFEDRAAIRAAALTYFTMLSIFPIFAIAFAVARNFGFEDMMHRFITSNMQEQEEVMNWVTGMVDKLHSPAYSTSVGLVQWAFKYNEFTPHMEHKRSSGKGGALDWENVKSFLRRLLP